MATHKLLLLPGDGIGPEVVGEVKRLVDWLNVPPGALVKPKDPLEYFRKLRFHQSVTSVRDYGLTPSGLVA
jgi:isocitrate/isopropylmalate dehydrogenase